MIIEETLEYEIKGIFPKVSEIEEFIKSKGIEPVRYSLIERKENIIKISVSGIRK